MKFYLNKEGLQTLLDGGSIFVSDGVHATRIEVMLDEGAIEYSHLIFDDA